MVVLLSWKRRRLRENKMWPKLTKEICSKTGEVHFKRWALLETPWFNIYLHKIFKSDEDKHLHNHPWNFKSFLLWGSYSELLMDKDFQDYATLVDRYWWGWAKRGTYLFHHLMLEKPVWTLVFTGKRQGDWGYLVDGKFVGHQEYRLLKKEGKL